MPTSIRISEDLVREAKIISKIDKRSVTGQIEHWARIGKCAEEKPDLTNSMINEILIGHVELIKLFSCFEIEVGLGFEDGDSFWQ